MWGPLAGFSSIIAVIWLIHKVRDSGIPERRRKRCGLNK